MTDQKMWSVSFHDEFDPEFDTLSQDVQDELLAAANAVQKLGSAADRPHVGTLTKSFALRPTMARRFGERPLHSTPTGMRSSSRQPKNMVSMKISFTKIY